MKACVIAETSAAARALCAGARGMADEVVLIAPGVEALTGVADKAVHIDVPSGNAIDDAYASVNSVVDAEAPGIVLVEPTRSMKVLAGRLAAHLGTAAITDVIEFEGDLATTMYFGGVGQRKSKANGTAIYTVGAGVFDEASASGTDAVEEAPFAAPARALRVTGTKDLPKSDVDLAAAGVVVAGGRGFAEEADLQLMRDVAAKLGGECGCSRPLAEGVDWMPREAYIGVSGTSQFGAYSGHNMTVVDLESFSIAYTVPTQGYPQTSGLLTTAYEDQDGYAYVYFFDNYTPGKLRVLRDKPGMTEVDHTYTTMETYNGDSGEVTIETGYVLFTPSGAQAQYAICSPIVDGEGNIYFKNDSAYMMRLSSRVTALEITRQPERTVYEIGETFDGAGMQVTALLANGMTRDVTDYVKFTAEPLTAEDTEITVSLDLTRLDIPGGPNWVFYQNRDGQTGQEWICPTGTVNIELKDGHVYGQPVWTWNDDFSAYAEFACTVNPRHEKLHLDAQVTSEVTTGSSCLEGGVRTYTAKVVLDGVTYTDVRTQPIPADGHKLSAVAEVPAACTENGVKAHWVCSVCGKLFSDAEGKTETTLEKLAIPATGHAYGAPVWKWNDDFTASATFTCTNDATHVKNVTAEVTSAVTTPAACETTGVRTYTAKVTFEGKDYTDTKTETLPATGHDTELVGAKDATCTEDGYTGDEVCKVCQTVVKQGEVIPALGHDYKDGKCSRCGAEEPTTPVEPGKPATGDSSTLVLWLALLAVSGMAVTVIPSRKKRSR